MSAELSDFEPGQHDDEVIALRAKVWGEDHPYNSRAYFEWLYQLNPAGRGSGVILRREGAIVGFAGMFARRLFAAGQKIAAAQTVDLMVDAGARSGMSGMYGYRLMDRWVKLALSHDCRFGIGFPNANSSRLVTSPKLGWRPTFSPILLIRPFARPASSAAPVRGIPPVAVAAGMAMLAGWAQLSQTLRFRLPPGRPVSLTRFDADFDALNADIEESPGIGTSRDSAYLNWRYIQHPLNRYDCVGWEVSGRARGFAVSLVREVFGFKAALVVDLAAENGMPDIEFGLLAEVQRRSSEWGAQMLATLAIHGSARYRRLLRFGFIPVPRRFDPKPFLFTTHDLGGATAIEVLETADWLFNWADMDVV